MVSNSITIKMLGEQGNQEIQIPSNYLQEYHFITIINMTDNSISIYPPHIKEPTAGLALYTWGAYQSMTVPVTPTIQNGFSIVWTNPHMTNTALLKTAQVIFSANNLGFNQSFAPSFTMGGNVIYTAIVNQQADLALESKQDDIITALGLQATAAKQDDIITALASQATEAKQDDIITALAGKATEAKQDDIITALASQATAAKQDDIVANLQVIGISLENIRYKPLLKLDTLLREQTRTVSQLDNEIFNEYGKKHLTIYLNVSAIDPTASLTITVSAIDYESWNYYELLSSAAITATGLYVLQLGPGITDIPNKSLNCCPVGNIGIKCIHANDAPITYSLSYDLI